MRPLIRNTARVVVLLVITGCADLPSDSAPQEQLDPETAQLVAAARAVSDELDMDAIAVTGRSTPAARREAVREALQVPQASCDLRDCVKNDVAVVWLNIIRVNRIDDDHVAVVVDRKVPRVQWNGDVEWHGTMYAVEVQRGPEGWWTATDTLLIAES